jgi:hypothetical protein
MKSHEDRRPFCPARTSPTLIVIACQLLAAGALVAQQSKPAGDKAAWQKHLDEMAKQTEQSRKGGVPPKLPGAAPPAATPPASVPAAPSTTPPASGSPSPGTQAVELFEDDFDQTSALSFVQHRVVLLVFAPQTETDSWRPDSELQPWSQRAVICPVHEGSLGDRAGRLAKAFGIDPAQGGMLTALVRAPDGVKQVPADRLLYQVLARYPAPHDATDVLKVLQEGVAAYEAKKTQYAWDATLIGANIAALPAAPPAAPSTSATTPSAAIPSPAPATSPEMPKVVTKPAKPVEPSRSPFETVVMRAWQTHRPLVLIFPGHEPFDKAKCADAWKTMPGALAPEFLVLTPGSTDGGIAGKPVDWEAFFDVNGQYPTALMVLPESEGASASPKVADMAYRVIARRQGALTPDSAAVLARVWMSEDLDAVIMRAWVLHRPLVLVFPHPEHERDLLNSTVLAKLEERAAVFVNTKDAVSGIRGMTAAQVEKDFATQAVERAEVVLVKLNSKTKDASSVRLDQIQLTSVNRAFAKKSPEKILDWVTSRVPAKP